MTLGDSKPALEASRETRVQMRTDDSLLQDLGLEVAGTPSTRNLATEAGHAMRRRWLAALFIGPVFGCIAAVGVWYTVPRQYTATSVLRISMDQANVLDLGKNGEGASSFDVYKRTQRQLLRSPAVLRAALQRKNLAKLPLVTQQLDPLTWLQNLVIVTFPDEAEIMNVSVRCEDRQAAELLVDTVVQVYLDDVVYAEQSEKRRRVSSLQKAETETEMSLRRKRSDLRQLADTLGTGDSEALTLAQKNTLQEYTAVWSQLKQVEWDLKRAQHARQIRNGPGPAAPDAGVSVSDLEVETAAFTDSGIAAAKVQVERLQTRIDEYRATLTPAVAAEYIAGCQADMERARKSIADRKIALRKELAYRKESLAQANNQSLGMSVELLAAQQKELEAKVGGLRKDAEKFGRSSIDVELMRAEIKTLEQLNDRIQREYHAASIEIANDKARVVLLSAATTPQNDDWNRRLAMSASSGGIGVFGSCVLVVLWDLRRRRLNGSHELANVLRLPILGSVPRVGRSRGGDQSDSQFEHAIDGIAARLIFSPSEESQQVILVTSASAGEGKTTVAVNLATSFAGMGRKTVLVDFDLRRPTLHNMFDLDLAPGIGGILAGQVEPLDAVHATTVENLFLLPAGPWGHRRLSGRNDNQVERIVSELRAAFVQVVIDAGPVLPVVDTRVVARHADGVIISLLRDVTEIPKVSAAYELLRSFNVRILGAVMIGVPGGEVYYARLTAPVTESVENGAV